MTKPTLNKLERFVDSAIGEMDIGGYIVPSINAPVILLDELKGKLLADNPPFAVMYWDEPEGRSFVVFSFDNDDRVDLREIVRPYRGVGDKDLASFRAPPQKEMGGEFIPLALEFPPDDIIVLGLFPSPSGDFAVADIQHDKDGKFEDNQYGHPIAWAYMPELPDSINQIQ